MLKKSFYYFALPYLLLTSSLHATLSFTDGPNVKNSGSKATITFTLSQTTDVEVAILNNQGEVVRHLAAGVLGGKLPPPAPLKQGLEQSIEWNKLDDFKKPATGKPFKVRIQAKMSVQFDGFIGEDPYSFGQVTGFLSAENGDLYISSYLGVRNQGVKVTRVYDSEGRYIREILPFPANLKSGSMKGVATFNSTTKEWKTINKSCLIPEFYNFGKTLTMVSASEKNGIVFAYRTGLYHINIDGSITNSFATGQKPWPIFDAEDKHKNAYGHPWHYNDGRIYYSASMDGKWLYLTGPYPNKKSREIDPKRFPLGGIYRMRIDQPNDTMKLFASIPAEYDGLWAKKGYNIYGQTGPVDIVGTDKDNNVYVPDRAKNRVVVFNEAGKLLGDFPVKHPHQVVIHPKNGAIYVLRMVCDGWGTHAMAIEKFTPFVPNNTTSVAVYDKFPNKIWPWLALSVTDKKTTLWIAGLPGLVSLEDKGDKLEFIPNKMKPRKDPLLDWNRMAVDYDRDTVYISDGSCGIWQFDGKTGDGGKVRHKNGKPFDAVDLAVGYDGLLYVRTGANFSGPLERFDKDFKPAPYPSGTHIISPLIYSRFGIGNCEKGLGIGPNGNVYIILMYLFPRYAVVGFGPDGKPLKGKYLDGFIGNAKITIKKGHPAYPDSLTTAIIGPVPSAGGGLRVDLNGNIYVGMDIKQAGHKPSSIFKEDPIGARWTSSVVKFGPQGGAVLGIKDSESQQPDLNKLNTTRKKVVLENAKTIYSGLGSISGGGIGGNSSCCACRVPRFDLDRYGRLIVPSSFQSSVIIYDNSGNVITTFGAYGNFDSQFINKDSDKGSEGQPLVSTPAIPMAWPSGAGFSKKAIYVNDTYNRRLIRAKMNYKLKKTIDL